MSESETEYLDACQLSINPIGLAAPDSQGPLVQLFPNQNNLGSGIALVRDAAGDFSSLGVFIDQALTDITQASNLKILRYLFERIRNESGKVVHLAAYGQHYGLAKEGRKHVLYLGQMDIAVVEFSAREVRDVMLLEPFDTDRRTFRQAAGAIAKAIIEQP